ncbi:MAG: crosslink repair DNA glycosylase YcaQ family protein [Fimbriimonas sp.]|nr:crosslink repair DNA glycosylase YcaQ family protein [Fimbriimonas sp.]
MNIEKLRAWWSHRQGLDGRLRGSSPAEILKETGWARSVGGSNPYFTLFARGHHSRARVDQAVVDLEIHELPSVRGCTYVLPAEDFAFGLTTGAPYREAEMRVAYKLGVTDLEIESLCNAILCALGDKTLSPDEIRAATGNASRSLGEEGKKKGIATTVPLALGKLQARGSIRRVPVDGRLDQQRYKYVRWAPNPRDGYHREPNVIACELARKFFRWTGPATLTEFQWFSALGVGAAKSAVAPLNLVPIEVDSDRLLLPEDLDKFLAFERPATPQYSLVSSIDGISLLRRDLQSIVDPEDGKRSVFSGKGMTNLGALADLPSNAILDRGRVIGLWEYDTTTTSIAWYPFVARNAGLDAAVDQTECFVRDQLGDARSFSLDSPKSREPLIAALRAAAD